MPKVVTMGEIMLRLSPPGNQRFIQASSFDVNYGGGEANVAVSLAGFGHDAAFVSKIPDNGIGNCAIAALRKNNVDCTNIVRGGKRLGIYYLENGASVRPSSVIYDREGSAITEADPEEFDFDKIFEQADLFHISGITPVISKKGAELTRAAMEAAKAHGVLISFDLNYRRKLWTDHITEKQRQMNSLMDYVDICFGNALDAAKCLGYTDGHTDFINGDYKDCVNAENMKKVVEHYRLKYLITTLRESTSASDNGWCAAVSDGIKLYTGKRYKLHIVDRVGGGDAFAAGFLHGCLLGWDMEKSLEFAIAAAAIKHTIPGDVNYVTVEEVESLVEGDGKGRVIR